MIVSFWRERHLSNLPRGPTSPGLPYHQKFGCAMGNPVSTVVANLVMEYVENCIFSSSNSRPIRYWKRFVDDVWVLLPKNKINDTSNKINSIESTIKFILENESGNSLPFLDVKVTTGFCNC